MMLMYVILLSMLYPICHELYTAGKLNNMIGPNNCCVIEWGWGVVLNTVPLCCDPIICVILM